jgi:hypothetical protein
MSSSINLLKLVHKQESVREEQFIKTSSSKRTYNPTLCARSNTYWDVSRGTRDRLPKAEINQKNRIFLLLGRRKDSPRLDVVMPVYLNFTTTQFICIQGNEFFCSEAK